MSYKPVIKLNTKSCKICKKEFKSEKALKDHIFNLRVKDKEHISYKKFLINLRFKGAKKVCPVCDRKFFRLLGRHLNTSRDKEHIKFKDKQINFFVGVFLKDYSPLDIEKVIDSYTTNFGYKYISRELKNKLGKNKFNEISRSIFSKKRKNYWYKFDKEKREKMMKIVYESQWRGLSLKDRKNHPWVKAGLKASLKSSKRGSKNQRYIYHLLKKEFPNLKLKYNYAIEKDWHVDIAIPDKNIFIEWDGRHHRIPIYGISYLNNRKNRDKLKNKIITKRLNGLLIRVRDDKGEDKVFVEKKLREIKNIICKKNIKYGEVTQI